MHLQHENIDHWSMYKVVNDISLALLARVLALYSNTTTESEYGIIIIYPLLEILPLCVVYNGNPVFHYAL